MQNSCKIILAIHSTKKFFGFSYRQIHNKNYKEDFFIKKFEQDLSNYLISDLAIFLSKISFHSIERICVSSGPANFNASRLIIVLARTLSQQLNCSLDCYNCFQLMAKRIAINNNIYKNKKTFWIVNKLKRKGYIAGKYLIDFNENVSKNSIIKELIEPTLYPELPLKGAHYEVSYDIEADLRELLELSFYNYKNSLSISWEKTLPLYPISPFN